MNFQCLPIEHYNYNELNDSCKCLLCESIRLKLQSVEPISVYVNADENANPYNDITKLINKQTIYSELSFLVRNRTWKVNFLLWVSETIQKDDWKSDTWWQDEGAQNPLNWWVQEWICETYSILGEITGGFTQQKFNGTEYIRNKKTIRGTYGFHKETNTYAASIKNARAVVKKIDLLDEELRLNIYSYAKRNNRTYSEIFMKWRKRDGAR